MPSNNDALSNVSFIALLLLYISDIDEISLIQLLIFTGSGLPFASTLSSTLFLLLNIPRNKIKDDDNFLKHKIYTLIFSSFTLFSVTYLVLTIYGIKLASLLQFPEFHLLKNISIFGFIERMENILALQWIFDYYVILTFLVLFIGDYTKPNKINYVIIGIIIVIISAFIFSSNTVGDTFIKHKLSHMIYFVYFFIPLLIAIKNKLQM